ncbi:MAG: hypothetical protein KGS48_07065 [Bacteroidetes bacterium]|nr:hypothetical protein [Bacteroidota bacterium]
MHRILQICSPFRVCAALSGFLLMYILLRAHLVSFTHDESASFLGFMSESWQDLIWNARNWGTANNHLLNTWSMQAGYALFGASEWALRWGSMAGGVLYLNFGLRTLRLYFEDSDPFLIAAFVLWACNPYLIEFFALARGYGWCLGLESAALFYTFRSLQTESRRDIWYAATALSVGILANFTLLDVLACWLVLLAVLHPMRRWAGLWPVFIPIVAVFVLIAWPMYWIRSHGEFEWGPPSIWETWRVLLEMYAFNPTRPPIIGKVLIAVSGTLGFAVILRRSILRYRLIDKSLWSAWFLFLGVLAVTVLQHIVLGANYLSGRTALVLYPLLGYVVIFTLHDLRSGHWWRALALAAFCNFALQANLRRSAEWPYDANTKMALLKVHREADPRRPALRYGVGWKHAPSTRFYQKTLNLNHIAPVLYDSKHDDVRWLSSGNFERIFVMPEFQAQIPDSFQLYHAYAQGALFRKK